MQIDSDNLDAWKSEGNVFYILKRFYDAIEW